VVVWLGAMFVDPLAATIPMLGSMLTLSALVEFQLRVVACPGWMLIGLAEMVTVGGGWIAVTVTVALAVTVPPIPMAVKVYVVVPVGDTLMEPVGGTLPIPWSIAQLSALEASQVSVADSPARIVIGDAEKLTVGGADVGIIATVM
jgi:hypothetical protein